jgi:hypothetical protein
MTIDQIVAALKALRGTHDQTMRCKAIALVYGYRKINGQTPTARFLEDMIAQAEETRARLDDRDA